MKLAHTSKGNYSSCSNPQGKLTTSFSASIESSKKELYRELQPVTVEYIAGIVR